MAKPDPRFLEGLRLFNHGDYFECHEVIEELWLKTPKLDKYRDLYKGVIQAAAAIYQEQRGIESGALGLRKTAVQYLAKYAPEALGLSVTPLINGLNDYFKYRDKKYIPVLEFKK